MLSVAIYSQDEIIINELKIIINTFLNQNKLFSNLHICKDEFTLMADSECDLYILDMDSEDHLDDIVVKLKLMHPDSIYTLISTEKKDADLISDLNIDYFLLKPLNQDKLLNILNEIKVNLRDSYILVPIAKGCKKLKVKDLNYIDLVGKNLNYHMSNGEIVEGPSITTSFEKATEFLMIKKGRSLLFIKPTLILNLNRIDSIIGDTIMFENEEKYYLKHTAKELVLESWKKFTRFVNLPEYDSSDY